MAGILIIAHAPLATALRECISHIYGGCPVRIAALDVQPDCDPAKVVEQASAQLESLREGNGALVLTDMFGATPSNIAAKLAALPDVRVLAGANLPMLVRSVCYRSMPLDALVDKALAGGSQGVHAVSPAAPAAAAAPLGDCSAVPGSPASPACPPAAGGRP